jgi:hypothetical protein
MPTTRSRVGFAKYSQSKPGSMSRLLVVESGDDRRLLGTLSHTFGDRLLFSPAAYVEVSTGDPTSRFEGETLDHLTLDPPRKAGRYSSHIAVRNLPQKKSRGVGWTTVPPAGHKIPWFSVLLATVDALPALPGRLVVHLPRRWSDAGAYAEQVIASIGGLDRIGLPDPQARRPSCSSTSGRAGDRSGPGFDTGSRRGPTSLRSSATRPRTNSVSRCPRELSRSRTA